MSRIVFAHFAKERLVHQEITPISVGMKLDAALTELRPENRKIVGKIARVIKSAELEIAWQPGVLFALVQAVSSFGVQQRSLLRLESDVGAVDLIRIAVVGPRFDIEPVGCIEFEAHARRAVR